MCGETMKISKIRPIPEYIKKRMKKVDEPYKYFGRSCRYYSYLTKNDGELVEVTVAVRNTQKNWYCKQVVVHGIHSDRCFLKDIIHHYIAGYRVGWHDQGIQKHKRWYEDGLWGYQTDKMFNLDTICVNTEYALKQKEYKYSAVDKLHGMYVLKYLRLYEKYPQAEYLMKHGLERYALSVQMLKKIGKDRKFVQWLLCNKERITKKYYDVNTILEAYKRNADLEHIKSILQKRRAFVKKESYKDIKGVFKGLELERLISYLEENKISLPLYVDYIKACQGLELDLTRNMHRFPKDFKHWHDVRIDEYRSKVAQLDAEKRKDFYAKFLSVATKYAALQHNKRSPFIAVIAMSPQELVMEGEALNHCVGKMGYDEKFADERSLIFFIRAKDAPEQPLVTVEYSLKTHKVLQCYGNHDSKPSEDILHYVNKTWLPYANKQIRQLQLAA